MVRPPRARLSLLLAFGVAALSVVVARTLVAGAAALAQLRRGDGFAEALSLVQQDLLVVGLCQLAGLVVALGVGVAVVHGPGARYREALDVRPVPAAVIGLALLAGLALAFPMREAVNLLVSVAPGLSLDPALARRLAAAVRIDGVADALVVPLAVVAIPALFEELLFRGLLQPALAHRYGARLGLFASAGLFGLAHLDPTAILYASALGLVLGHLRDRTGSVMPAVALHGAFNAVPVLVDPRLVRVEGFNVVSAEVQHLPLPLALGGAAVAAVALTVLGRLAEDPSRG